jgi:LytS/YehU family sensor histidine kinase
MCLVAFSAVTYGQADIRELLTANADAALKWLILTGFAIFGYTLTSFMLFSYQHYAVMQVQALHLKRTQLALQTELLKSQLSPHYLFNSLNTISSLAHRDAGQAEQFVRKLAHTYQYVLNTHDQPLVRLEEELQFVRAYNHLLKVRFEGAIQIREEVAAHLLGCRVPPLTLQMLVENAVKHNAVSRESPLHICIYSDSENYLNVINTIGEQQPAAREHSLKVGLENIRKRYHYHTNQQIQVAQEGYYTVRLPLLAG